MSNEHWLKTWPEVFMATVLGLKTAEFRKNDRGYAVGDVLRLMEWDPATEQYTGQETMRVVKHIVEGPNFGISEGYVMMSVGLKL